MVGDDDRAPEPSPDDPFMPIVESLLKYPLDSRDFRAAAEVAGPAELAEVKRQLDQQIAWSEERNEELEERRRYFVGEFPGIGEHPREPSDG